jgi:hypothetical protein
VPLTVDRRETADPGGAGYVVVSSPMGITGAEPHDWPEPVNWVTTAPGLMGIFEMLRNRLQFRGAWQVDVYAKDPTGRPLGRVHTERAKDRYTAAGRVAALADQIHAGEFPNPSAPPS